jgi:PKD repeat protein
MDKKLLFLIALAILSSGGFFAYRKIYYKPEGISYEIKPRGAIQSGDSIAYSDKTPGATRWKWDFGDGEYSADQSGHHTYLSAGKFDVTLTAYGPFGVQKKTESVTVIGRDIVSTPAGPSIIGPESVKIGVPARWESSATAATYEWKVEGDALLGSNVQKGNNATYAFKSAGQRTLVLSTHNPDAVTRRSIMVMAAEQPQVKPAQTTAAIPMPPQQHAAPPARPKPTHHDAPAHKGGNNLEDLGDGVEIKK